MSQLDASQPDELETRAKLIDQQLSRAGWSKNKRNLIEEFVLKAAEPEPGSPQFSDYALLSQDITPLALV